MTGPQATAARHAILEMEIPASEVRRIALMLGVLATAPDDIACEAFQPLAADLHRLAVILEDGVQQAHAMLQGVA